MESTFTALLVEDELQILNGMKGALSSSVPEISAVYTASNGSAALEQLRKHAPDFVITDLCMPVMGGVEFVREMRREGFAQPVLVLTALEDFKAAQALIPCQIENYIVKPFSYQDILDETRKIIDKLCQAESLNAARILIDTQPEIIKSIGSVTENPVVQKAKAYANAHLAEALSLQSLADALYISKTYLSALFKREMGVTVNDYITTQRLKKAKSLLLETDLRIWEICEQVGYQSNKYFIQVFRSHEGTTPLAFRQSLQRQIDQKRMSKPEGAK
jgi:YesN/AraC family two-component response regulator